MRSLYYTFHNVNFLSFINFVVKSGGLWGKLCIFDAK